MASPAKSVTARAIGLGATGTDTGATILRPDGPRAVPTWQTTVDPQLAPNCTGGGTARATWTSTARSKVHIGAE